MSEFIVRDTRMPGHFWADNEVLDVFGSQLGAHAFAVYMCLCRNAINTTGECRISVRVIARQIGMSVGGVFNALEHICRMGLARKVEVGDRTKPTTYILADIKALVDPSIAQMKLSMRGVHGVNTQQAVGVHGVNASVHGVNGVFTGRTRNKERKTITRLKTKTLDLQQCAKCRGTGSYESAAHPGRQVWCHCSAGGRRRRDENQASV